MKAKLFGVAATALVIVTMMAGQADAACVYRWVSDGFNVVYQYVCY